MVQKYHIGFVLENGRGIIVDGPLRGKWDGGKKYVKWKIKCMNCGSEAWKFSNTFNGLKHGCKRCYDESLKRFDDSPAKKKAWRSLCVNAKARELEVKLTFDEFCELAKSRCFYCGAEPVSKGGYKKWHQNAFLNGIDRVDSGEGYTAKNSVPCCFQCNWSKKDLNVDEWLEWVEKLSENLKSKGNLI